MSLKATSCLSPRRSWHRYTYIQDETTKGYGSQLFRARKSFYNHLTTGIMPILSTKKKLELAEMISFFNPKIKGQHSKKRQQIETSEKAALRITYKCHLTPSPLKQSFDEDS